MNTKVAKNLGWLMLKKGFNSNTLADALEKANKKVPQPTIHRILSGESTDPRTSTLEPLASFFGVTVADLRDKDLELGGESITLYDAEDAIPEGIVLIPEYDIDLSAGNGTINYEENLAEPRAYKKSWFSKEGINPKYAKRFKVHGDSMEPILFDGDSVLVNMDENDTTRIIEGKIYAIRYGNELRVKRLSRRLDGTITLHSDNKAYKDEEIKPENHDAFAIIGRVRDKSGSGGL